MSYKIFSVMEGPGISLCGSEQREHMQGGGSGLAGSMLSRRAAPPRGEPGQLSTGEPQG